MNFTTKIPTSVNKIWKIINNLRVQLQKVLSVKLKTGKEQIETNKNTTINRFQKVLSVEFSKFLIWD